MSKHSRLANIVGIQQRRRIVLLVILMIIASLFEMLGIASAVSVCAIIANLPNAISNPFMHSVWTYLGKPDNSIFAIDCAIISIIIYVVRAIYLILETYIQARFVRNVRHEVATRIMHGFLRQPYLSFVLHNRADFIKQLTSDTNRFATYLECYLRFTSESIVIIFITVLLLIFSPIITFLCAAGLVIVVLAFRNVIRKRVMHAGKQLSKASSRRLNTVNQAINGIKDLKITQSESYFEDRFELTDGEYAAAEYVNRFWNTAPSYAIESIVIVSGLFFLVIEAIAGTSLIESIPTIAAFGLVLIRLVPASNRINNSLTSMTYNESSLDAVEKSLEEAKVIENAESKSSRNVNLDGIKKAICARNVQFSYADSSQEIFKNVNVTIPIGSSVGIVGPTGAGKTTLIDLLLGLLEPTSGQVKVDDIPIDECLFDYLKYVAYIPQNVFIMEGSILSNVAFGIDRKEIDERRVWQCLERASLAERVRKMPEGLDAPVGDSGLRLSGGERQRLAIARAFYSGCEIIFMDEGTSALDEETEREILKTIETMPITTTFVIVAHDPRTIEGCKIIYKVDDGTVIRQR